VAPDLRHRVLPGAMRHNAVQVSIDGVRLGIALSQIAGVHGEKCLLPRLGEPRLTPDRSGDCVDLTPGLGGLGVWTHLRREVFPSMERWRALDKDSRSPFRERPPRPSADA
jgi:hypothetical protein